MRYYGAYANRALRLYRKADGETDRGGHGGPEPDADAAAESEYATERRKSWARLLRKILESLPRRSLGEGGSIRCCT